MVMFPYTAKDETVGAARLSIVAVTAFGSFIYSSLFEYCLPFYFNSLPDFPRGIWADLVAWQVAPWCIGPILAGLLARRYGERRVWAAALYGQAFVPLALIFYPNPALVAPLAAWNGLTAALMWVGGISLAQVVPQEKKALSNGLIMTALGVGSVAGPLLGRALLWSDEFGALWRNGGVGQVGRFLIDLIKPQSNPGPHRYVLIFSILTGFTLFNALLIGLFGQRRDVRVAGATSHSWQQTVDDMKQLAVLPRYWVLVGALCLCGGPVFQTMNQFLLYRAQDLGLVIESRDHGWIVLQFIRMAMWIVGGIAVGALAGRRPGAMAAAVILGSFSLAAIAVGMADTRKLLFTAAIVFEFVRQFMRWSHSGFMAEQVDDRLRATAIGTAITVAGLSSTAFGFIANLLGDANAADFDSSVPFFVAGGIGCIGALGLLAFDRYSSRRPIDSYVKIDAQSELPVA